MFAVKGVCFSYTWASSEVNIQLVLLSISLYIIYKHVTITCVLMGYFTYTCRYTRFSF